jgi:hypothetical protein
MTELGTAIAEQVILNYGQSGFLTRLSDPFWFQAYGTVMGMDWHSSGITTSVLGALKRGMNPRFPELGLMFCGGRGRHSVRTPDELRAFSLKNGLDGDALARTSRITARVDNNAVADGFQLYLHSFDHKIGGMGGRATGDESRESFGAGAITGTRPLCAISSLTRIQPSWASRWARFSILWMPAL